MRIGGLFHPWRPKLAVKVAFAASMHLENNDFFDHKHLQISKNKILSREKFFSTLSDSVKLGVPKNPVETAVKHAFGGKNTDRYFIREGANV